MPCIAKYHGSAETHLLHLFNAAESYATEGIDFAIDYALGFGLSKLLFAESRTVTLFGNAIEYGRKRYV